MNSKIKIPSREIIFLSAGEIATSVIIIAVYLLIGKFDYTVVTGAALGSLVTVLNFLFLSITVNRTVDKILAERDFTPSKTSEPEYPTVSGADLSDGDSSDEADEDEEAEPDDEAARFARKYEKKLQASIKLSYAVRTLTMIGALVAALITKQFNVIATVIPLFMLRPLLTISEMTKRKEE
jgi:hypothetical protein